MATKRVVGSAIEWGKIAERVPVDQKAKFLAFRTQSDKYLRRMMANPENPPKIEWAYYKKYVPIPGLVEEFQKRYDTLQIPYPKDTVSHLIDVQEQEIKKEIVEFKAASNARISSYNSEIERIRGLLPYEQMTMEDYAEAHPDLAFDPINKPTFWPHNPEDQPGYKPEQTQQQAH